MTLGNTWRHDNGRHFWDRVLNQTSKIRVENAIREQYEVFSCFVSKSSQKVFGALLRIHRWNVNRENCYSRETASFFLRFERLKKRANLGSQYIGFVCQIAILSKLFVIIIILQNMEYWNVLSMVAFIF